MIVVQTVKEMQELSKKYKIAGKSIGYVATMGFLHEGHLELVKRAREKDHIVVMSIFVNPTQFGPNEDFDQYPRDFERDRQLAQEHGVDILFYPSVSEMYPFEQTTEIHVVRRTDVLCGKSRPGHFEGVATVLFKLFHIVMPDNVYFGLKDAQQVAVIDGFLKDYFFPINLIPCPTVREEDGLAKSSRNVNLTAEERKEAPILYQSLREAKKMSEDGEYDADKILRFIYNKIEQSISGKIDYVEILSYPDLKPIKRLNGQVIIAIAVRYSKVRLIDNIIWTIGGGK
ncbi:pantoate--beta-alanine ligase [Pueribacillus theae]|uniref:Pantothenate synthetase n=1 Tax=Pueribacillus theae TaxID=2171751 RepID=A0A2U1K5T3_9BACI|nr:pantoate--beta-alanine ligase [Pueribacillus theae]PWA12343.1 pantoate--beta-alanine ligase [Pueribacillus theae]